MVLKRIEICGFKSFPDRTVLEFPDGITAIVGSNGCGKSNVSDAVRWVLGEQSAKSLRGEKMDDLIFAGTATRKPMQFAEVVLTFDNSHKLFPLEFSEVSIGRRLFRDGQSSYLLNKQECRLRDVYDLLMDSGIGRRAHSIIEQGKIDEIVMARPEERRHLIEEAAGIAKYRSRRAEALRRLENTREGLQRVDDLLAEMERQEQSLRRQSKKAERYREIQAELKETDLAHASLQMADLECRVTELSATQSEVQKHLIELEAEISSTSLDIERRKKELEDGRSELRESGRRLGETEKAYSAAESQLREVKARQADDENAIRRISHEVENLARRIGEAERSGVEAEGAAAGFAASVETLTSARAEADVARQSLRGAFDEARSAVASDRNALSELTENIARAESELTFERRAVADLEDRLDRARAHRDGVRREREILGPARRDAAAELGTAIAENLEIEKGLNSCIFNIEGLTREIEALAAEQRVQDRSHAEIAARLSAAVARARATSEEISRASEGLSCRLRPVSELPLGAPEYAAALAGALGEALGGVAVEGETGAGSALDAARSLTGRTVFGVAPGGVESWIPRAGLIPLRSCLAPDAHPSVASWLAGWYLVADDAEAASMLASIDECERIVTRSGDVFHPSGAVRRLPLSNRDDVASSRERFEEDLARIRFVLDEIESRLEGLKDGRQSLERDRVSLEKDRQAVAARVSELQARLEGMNERWRGLEDDGGSEIERLESGIAGTLDRIVAGDLRLTELQVGLVDARTRHEASVELLRGLEAEAERQSTVLAGIDRELTSAAERLEARRAEAERLRAWAEESRQSLSRQEEMLAEVRLRHEKLTNVVEELLRGVGRLASELEERRADFNGHETRCREFEHGVAAVERMHAALQKSREEAMGDLHEHEVEAVRLAGERTLVADRVREKYGEADLSRVPLGPDGQALVLGDVAARLAELREMLDRMGGVNWEAAAELEDVVKRLAFYHAQREDLARAESGLSEVVADIDRQTETLFMETFTAVNTNFTLLFNRLFGGRTDVQGTAELVLLDPARPLESGVDILAMPPGKKLQTISLLSGGEKALTAVALLFSVFLVRPSPFAVLDELDAPLDEANVGKYVQLLREFAQRSQFIIITHNKRTMEAADTLYGVSQSEKGISRVLGVRLDDAEAIPEAAG